MRLERYAYLDVFMLSLIGLMGMITMLLVIEYRHIKEQYGHFVQMKQQYESYVRSLRSIIERATDIDVSTETFMRLNRNPDYLRESILSHINEQNLQPILKGLHEYDAWFEPPQQTVQRAQQTSRRPMQRTQSTSQRTTVKRRDMNLAYPVDKNRFWLSSFFGPRKKPNGEWGFHYGLDMAALKGTPVKAAASGIVVEARYGSGYGNTVVVQHNKKYKTRYAHLSAIGVQPNQHVVSGQVIGKVGDTGLVRKSGKDASHLHFEVYQHGKQVNPLYYLT